MAHYAQIDDNNIVIQVIVAEQNFIDSGAVGDPEKWIRTSYNTQGGVHLLGKAPLRMNYAGIGYIYHKELDAFIPPKPFNSWKLNEVLCAWEAPKPKPNNNKMYIWNETILDWEESTSPLILES